MAYKPPSWMGAGKKDDKPKAANPMARFGTGAPKTGNSSNNPMARFGNPSNPSPPKKGTKSSASPVSAAAQAKADKAQKSANRFAQVQRAANKAKKAVIARKGPQDLAGREQRKMDLARYRELQKGADSWKNRARSEGIRFGGDKPAGVRPAGGGSGATSGGGGGGGASAGSAVARAAGTQAGRTSNPTRPQAPKAGAVLAKARKMENSGRGVPITAKELSSFMDYYNKTHKGTLSRSDAVMMARLLKKNSPQVAKKYGLNIATEN